MGVTINSLQIENTKRVKAFALEPGPTGLTVIGGKNGNGKTSVLDGIAWVIGGNKFKPSNAQRDGSMNPPNLKVTLSNGIIVERKGKNSTLIVTDPTGKRHGQALLDSLIGPFAVDLPKFTNENDKGKAQILLQILGIGDELRKLDQDEERIYNERHAIGQQRDKKAKHAEELPEYPDAPDEPVSASALIKQQQSILAKNGENARHRDNKEQLQKSLDGCRAQILDLEAKLTSLREQESVIVRDLATAEKTVEQLEDESTAEIEKNLEDIEAINAHVAANQQKARAQDEAAEYSAQYIALSEELEATRKAKIDLLNGADLPLPELSVTDGVITYRDQPWDCMSGAEQLIVATAIVRCLNPECGFVLMDKLEQFDTDTLASFDEWLKKEGLQSIATRVSTGEECTIIIEDGLPAGQTYVETTMPVEASEPADTDNPYGEWK